MRRGRGLAALLLLVGLGTALLGQFYFAFRREYVWDGVLFWALAILSFVLLWRCLARQAQRRNQVSSEKPGFWHLWWRRHWRRALLAAGGAALAVLAGYLARRWPQEADFTGVLLLWLTGVGCFLCAFVPSVRNQVLGDTNAAFAPSHEKPAFWELVVRRVERAGYVRLLGMAALLILALAVRAYDLEHIPANLGGDEGSWGMEGLAMLDGRLANPFATRWFSFPSMSFLAWGLSMRVFGQTIGGMRALSALIGTATVLTTFLLARHLWGSRVAWMAAAALAFGHFHIHFSRLAVNNVGDGLLVTLALWLAMRGLRSPPSGQPEQEAYVALAGAVLGLSLYGYFGARLIGVILACYLARQMVVEHRFLARYGRLLLLLVVAALVVAAPLLLYYVDHPDTLFARSRQVSVFGSGWLARERESAGRTTADLLWQQCWRSVSAFHYTLDPTFWYRPAIPLLDFASGVLFVLGLVWVTLRGRWPANGLLLIWFWLAVVLGWMMTENPPSSMRLVIVSPALALLVGLGLDWLIELGRRVLGGGRRLWQGVAGASLVVVAVLNLTYYFAVYTPTRVYGNPTAEVGTELGRYLAQREDDADCPNPCVVYFYGPPFMYWDFGTLRFLARGVEGFDVPPREEEEAAPVPDPDRGACFVFLPERLDELPGVRAQYPGGVETPVYSAVDARPLYWLYEVENLDF